MQMRKTVMMTAMAGLLATSSLGMIACERHEGPAERAGEKIDKAADNVADAINPKGPVEKAGRAIDRATDKH
jgi:hypothetical protein